MFRRVIEYIGDSEELNPDSDKWLCEDCYDEFSSPHEVIDVAGNDYCIECEECGGQWS